MKLIRLTLIFVLLLSPFGSVKAAAESGFFVNSTLDLPDADLNDSLCATQVSGSVCTLRAAVMQANASPTPATITISGGTYQLTRTGTDDIAAFGDLDITKSINIRTNGYAVTIDGNGSDRVFEVLSGTLNLLGITIQNGHTSGFGGGIYAHGGSLILDGVTIQNNSADQGGGGVYDQGEDLKFNSVIVFGNTSAGNGAGISVVNAPSNHLPNVVLTNGHFLSNHITSMPADLAPDGGGMYIYNVGAKISGSNFSVNSTLGAGGGLAYSTNIIGLTLAITDTTFFSNTAAVNGGGAFLYGTTRLNKVNFNQNLAGVSGGGVSAFGGPHILNDVTATNNKAKTGSGGGISLIDGSLTLNRGWLESNSAHLIGGGLSAAGSGANQASVTDSNILKNSAAKGGGVGASTQFFVQTSAIYMNTAPLGAGVYGSMNTSKFENTTISENNAGQDGGGIYADTSAFTYLNNVSIYGNHASTTFSTPGTGGGIYSTATGIVYLLSTVLGQNYVSGAVITSNDCYGTLQSFGYNFIGSTGACILAGDLTGSFQGNIDPMLGPLEIRWGFTPAHYPKPGSPLINAGPQVGCQADNGSFLVTDQVGHPRSLDGRCDIGAVEAFTLSKLFLAMLSR